MSDERLRARRGGAVAVFSTREATRRVVRVRARDDVIIEMCVGVMRSCAYSKRSRGFVRVWYLGRHLRQSGRERRESALARHRPTFCRPRSVHFSGAFGSTPMGSSVSSAGVATPAGSWMSAKVGRGPGVSARRGEDVERKCWRARRGMSFPSDVATVTGTHHPREGCRRATRRRRCRGDAPRASPFGPCRSSFRVTAARADLFQNEESQRCRDVRVTF